MTAVSVNHSIVGCGRVAASHAEAFARLPGVSLWSCHDPVAERATALAQRFGIGRVESSYEAVLNDPQVTSLSLAVPHDLHVPMVLQALERGKHVLVEKPFALFPEEGARVIERVQHTRLTVVPVAQHRYDPMIRTIQELLRSGDMGEVRLVRAHLECRRPPEYYRDSDWRGRWAREGGSVLINQAYHIVDLLLHLLGPVKTVAADMATFSEPGIMETEDTLVASLTFERGTLGGLTLCGSAGAQWGSYIELLGARGLVAFDINHPNQLHRFQLESKRAMLAWKQRLTAPLPEDLGTSPAGIGYYGTSHRAQAQAFVACILGGEGSPFSELAEALEVVRVVRSLYASARSRSAGAQRTG